jgi:hypothetical protein
MALSNAIPGRKPKPPREEPLRPSERPSHAPTFVRSHDEQEPRTVGGYSLEDTTDRRTFAVKASTQDA